MDDYAIRQHPPVLGAAAMSVFGALSGVETHYPASASPDEFQGSFDLNRAQKALQPKLVRGSTLAPAA